MSTTTKRKKKQIKINVKQKSREFLDTESDNSSIEGLSESELMRRYGSDIDEQEDEQQQHKQQSTYFPILTLSVL